MSTSMDYESEGENSDAPTAESRKQLAFVLILKKYKVLLDKSQIPAVKQQKQDALKEMSNELKLKNGCNLTTLQLSKKINNMKTAVKNKTDKNATGNKKIILSDWEKLFVDLMDKDNPVLQRVPGCMSAGSCLQLQPKPEDDHKNDMAISISCSTASPTIIGENSGQGIPVAATHKRPLPPPPPSQAKKVKSAQVILDSFETDETRNLSLSQLNRLVMLKQLKLLGMKINKLETESTELV